jgi:tetratricopeptide (TPR) repeat protein
VSELAWALEEYLELVARGEAPSVESWLARYPDIADELEPALAAVAFLHGTEEPQFGQTLGDFQLVREIARGGMGVVYEATQQTLDRKVALKVLPFAAVLDSRQLQRFRIESQAAAHLHHNNIVPVFAVGQERGVHYYAMQYVEGRSLAELTVELRAGVPDGSSSVPLHALTPGGSHTDRGFVRNIARLGADVAAALQYAHGEGVVHRDIKPGNLLVDAQTKVWITDFGLARGQTDQSLTATGDLIGTLRYMSPEQTRGQPADARSDVYSLGATLYEVLALRPAFSGDDAQRVLVDIGTRDPSPLRALNGAVPEELETVIAKAMAKEPTERYPSAGALEDDLLRFLENRPIVARRPTALDRMGKWALRHRRALPFAAAGLLITLATFVVAVVVISDQRDVAEDALQGEKDQRTRAERNFERAMAAVDHLLVTVDEEFFRDVPHLARVRRAVLERALAFQLEFLEDATDEPEVRLESARAHVRVARIKQLMGEAGAAPHFQSALDLLGSLPSDADRDRELAQVFYWRAIRRAHAAKLVEAERDFLACRTTLRKLEPLHAVDQRTAADALARLGEVQRRQGKPDEAIASLNESVAEWQAIRKKNPDHPAAHFGELHARQTRANIRYQNGAEMEGWQSFERLLDGFEELARDHPQVPRYRHAFAQHLARVANARRAHDDLPKAVAAQERAVAAYENLIDDFPAVPAYAIDSMEALSRLGFMRERNLDKEGAGRAYGDATARGEDLLIKYPEVPDVLARVGGNMGRYASFLTWSARHEEAAQVHRRAIAIYEDLVKLRPDVPRYCGQLNWKRAVFATVSPPLGWEECDALYKAATKGCEEFLERHPSTLVKYQLSRIVRVHAQKMSAKTDRDAEAAELFRRSAEILEELLKTPEPAHYWRRDLGATRNRIGINHLSSRNHEAALEEFQRALVVMKEVDRNRPGDRETLGNIGAITGNVGLALEGLGRDSEAMPLFEEQLAWRKKALERVPEHPDSISEVVKARLYVANRLHKEDPGRAESLYRDAIAACDTLIKKKPKAPGYNHWRGIALADLALLRYETHGDAKGALDLLDKAEECQRAAIAINRRPKKFHDRLREHLEQRMKILEALGDVEAVSQVQASIEELKEPASDG